MEGGFVKLCLANGDLINRGVIRVLYVIIFLLLSMELIACHPQTEKKAEKPDTLVLSAGVDDTIYKNERSSISECIRAKAEPIVKKSVFPNTSFKLNADRLSAVETIELENGDKVRIENTGCEYYVLTFRIETARFQGDISDLPFWYDKAFLIMTDLARGIDAPIQINKGLQYLKSYRDENRDLELGKEIDFGGEDIRDILTIHRILKLTDELFAIELSFAMGPL